MSTGSWLDNDGRFIQYGTQKTIPDPAGDYLNYGSERVIEVLIDLTSLTTTAQVQSMTTFFPAGYNIFIDKVEVVSDVASANGTSFSVGLGYFSGSTYANITNNTETATAAGVSTQANTGSYPGITSISDTAFVTALINSQTNTTGDLVTIVASTATYAGAYLGTTSTTTTHPNYITAKAAGTYTAGLMRVRIFYRGYGTIIN